MKKGIMIIPENLDRLVTAVGVARDKYNYTGPNPEIYLSLPELMREKLRNRYYLSNKKLRTDARASISALPIVQRDRTAVSCDGLDLVMTAKGGVKLMSVMRVTADCIGRVSPPESVPWEIIWTFRLTKNQAEHSMNEHKHSFYVIGA